jgi:hypothetical protein
MTEPSQPPGSRAIHEWSGGQGNLPTVIYAPPPGEPSVTRGVTGLFVPIFLGIFILLAIYFYTGAWNASQQLSHQQAVTRDASGLLGYIEDLERQNADMCQRLGDLPDRVERPNLEVQLQTARREFDVQCQHNQRLQDRLQPSEAGGVQCTTVTPAARSEPAIVRTASGAERRETVPEFRNRICRSYLASAPRR